MVNVGGRSKGCTTCRKRHVKCDEGQPVCSRCQKSGLHCDGPKGLTFVVGTIVKTRRSTKGAARDSSNTDCCLSHVPRKSLLSSSEFEVYICYALKVLRRGGCIELSTRSIQPTELTTPPVPAAMQRIHISHQAIFSFAAIFFGKQHRQARITNMGFDLYGMVLQRLNKALSDSAYNTNDDLIYAVVTLSIMEMFISTGAGNHLKHMEGLERLLALRDHSLPCSLETAELYRSLRQMTLYPALRTRRASILARPEWKKQLREHVDSNDRLMQQELFDVLADCTVVIASRERIISNAETIPEINELGLSKLKEKATSLRDQLHCWRERWDNDERHKVTERPLSDNNLDPLDTDLRTDILPFDTTLEYLDDFAAITVMLYNIALIYVLHILALLTSPAPAGLPYKLSSTTPLQPAFTTKENIVKDPPHFPNIWSTPITTDQSANPPNPYLLAQKTPVLDICRSVPYHLINSHRASSSTLHWAMATIWIKLRGEESVVGRWVERVGHERNPLLVRTMKTLAQ